MAKPGLLRLQRSIFAKFALAFITAGLFPLLILGFISLSTFSDHMERYAINNYEQMLLFAGRNLEDMYAKYNNISKLMYTYGADGYGQLGEAISAQSKTEDLRLRSTIDYFLRTVVYTDKHLQNAFFIMQNGQVQLLTKENKTFDFRYSYPQPEWMDKLRANRKELAFFPTHRERYFMTSNRQVMTFGRNLLDVSGPISDEGRIVGTLFMDVDLGAFDEIFEQIVLSGKDEINVLDAEGNCLYSNNPEKIGKKHAPETSLDYMQLQHEIPATGWTINGSFYKPEMFHTVEQIIRSFIVIISLCMISLIVVAVWFSRRFSNPIRSITRQMAKVESGNLDVQAAAYTNDELGLLAHGFNKMVVRLQSFINEVYVAQIKQKQAELNALRKQIRPHYLYNTLEVIRMSAVADDNREVADMILSLSKQLKYVLDEGQETVTFLEEKSNVEDYFRLMAVRYGDHKLAMDIRFDSNVLLCHVPKLSLQPLVENAIYHGIMPKAGRGSIRITAEEIPEGRFCMTVDDDGVGMSAEHLAQLLDKLHGQQPGQQTGSIGLRNVHERIVGLYGADYGVEISSREQIGTSVRIVLPLLREVQAHAERCIGG